MSVTSSTASVQYTQASPTQGFSVPFYFLAEADIAVVRTRGGSDTLLTITTDYTVSGAGTLPPTGAILMVAGLAGDVVTIYRAGPFTQTYDFTANGPFPAATMTQKVDYLTMLCQQLELAVSRSLRVPNTNAVVAEMTLAQRANNSIGFDGAGNLVFGGGPALTTYAALRAIPTVGVANYITRPVSISIDADNWAAQTWMLIPSTHVDDGSNWLRPVDYNASTNARVWTRTA